MASQSCIKKSLVFCLLGMVASAIAWFVLKSWRQDNRNTQPYNRSCGDICGIKYFFEDGSSCCDYNYQNCRNRYDCRDSLEATYSMIQNLMTFIFVAFAVCTIILYCYRRQRRNRQRLASQLHNIYERNNQNSLIENADPSILNLSQQNESNNINQVLRHSFSVRDSQNICTICFEAYEDSKSLMLKCGHLFHSKCIRAWARRNNSCPVCRVDI